MTTDDELHFLRAATVLENDDDEKYNWCDYQMIQSYQQKNFRGNSSRTET